MGLVDVVRCGEEVSWSDSGLLSEVYCPSMDCVGG